MALGGSLAAQIFAKSVLQNASGTKTDYNATTGRGYLLSNDGRSGFFVKLAYDSSGNLDAAQSQFAITQTKASYATTTIENTWKAWVAGTTNQALSNDSNSGLLEGASGVVTLGGGDYTVQSFDAKSIGVIFSDVGYKASDFSSTFGLLNAWTEKVAEIAQTESYAWDSGIWHVAHSYVTGARPTILFSEGASATLAAPNAITDAKLSASSEYTLITKSWISSNPATSAVSTTAKKVVYAAGNGYDILTTDFFTGATTGATVDLRLQTRATSLTSSTAAQTATYEGKTFLITGFEEASMTSLNDTFIGDGYDNAVTPGGGVDILNGGGYAYSNGSASDTDWVSYFNASSGIVARGTTYAPSVLSNGTQSVTSGGTFLITDYNGSTDTATNFEGVRGGLFNDKFYGGSAVWNQQFVGFKGNDLIDGGAGFDTANYGLDIGGVVVNLSTNSVNSHTGYMLGKVLDLGTGNPVAAIKVLKLALDDAWADNTTSAVKAGTAIDGWGTTDKLINIEAATGSAFNDQLYGSNAENSLFGGAGFDILVGNGGNDSIIGGYGHDIIYGGLGKDWIVTDDIARPGTIGRTSWDNRWIKDEEDGGNLIIYKSVTESSKNAPDFIDGFTLTNDSQDIIDLSAIDANTQKIGNQAFSKLNILSGNSANYATPKAGSLILYADSLNVAKTVQIGNDVLSLQSANNTVHHVWNLEGDINGDGKSDFQIKLIGINDPTSTDIVSIKDCIIY